MAHRRLDGILRGRPIQLTCQRANGSMQILRDVNGRPKMSITTKHWLGGRCHGSRFPGQMLCRVVPRNNVRIADCTGIPPSLDQRLRNNPCCGSICRFCVINVGMFWEPNEQALNRDSRRAHLCHHCSLFEVRRNPNGLNTCKCRRLLSEGWKCWTCRGETLTQLRIKLQVNWSILRDTHRDRYGRMIHNSRLRRMEHTPCPGCGRSSIEGQLRHGRSVIYCLLCKGLEVAPTLGREWQYTALISKQPTRRSTRVAARYARQPDLDFTPVRV